MSLIFGYIDQASEGTGAQAGRDHYDQIFTEIKEEKRIYTR